MKIRMKVADTSEIPVGKAKCLEVAGHTITVFHIHGANYAIDNTCPHYGRPLSAGWVQGTTVTCPWHGVVFDVTSGDVISGPAPHPTGSGAIRSTLRAIRCMSTYLHEGDVRPHWCMTRLPAASRLPSTSHSVS
jgi:3-phenylpropionate/trans-cinnamate dioxygenase ferredoxin component